jgi:hypothetical protein
MQNFTLVDKCVALVAKRNSGKSILLKRLVTDEIKQFNKIFVICPTEAINHFYSEIVTADCIFDEYNEEWCGALIEKMTKINAGKKGKEHKKVLLILDDCVADTKFHQSPSLKKLYARGRHISISVIITTQYLLSIPPLVRLNSDYILAGQLNNQSLQILCDEFLSGDLNRADFLKMYNRTTKDYNFLVINNNSVLDTNLNNIYGVIRVPDDSVK